MLKGDMTHTERGQGRDCWQDHNPPMIQEKYIAPIHLSQPICEPYQIAEKILGTGLTSSASPIIVTSPIPQVLLAKRFPTE